MASWRGAGADEVEGARDVGAAMGRNPVPIVIPCHRVLAAGGKLGGFSATAASHQAETARARRRPLRTSPAPRLPRLPGVVTP